MVVLGIRDAWWWWRFWRLICLGIGIFGFLFGCQENNRNKDIVLSIIGFYRFF